MLKYLIFVPFMLFIFSSFINAREYQGEGPRVYRAFIKKSIIEPGPDTGKGTFNYFLLDKNGKEIQSKWEYDNEYVPISLSYHVGYPSISISRKTRDCLEEAAKKHHEVEISGKWLLMGEGTEGFDESTVRCKKLSGK